MPVPGEWRCLLDWFTYSAPACTCFLSFICCKSTQKKNISWIATGFIKIQQYY